MAFRKRRSYKSRGANFTSRSGSKFSYRSSRRRSSSRSGGARKSAPQIVRIVIENQQPQAALPPPLLPEQLGNVVALTKPRGARF